MFDRATEQAGTGEYIQLEFRTQNAPLSSAAGYQSDILQQLNQDDRYIVARPPSIPIAVGGTTLGFGYGASEAVIRMTAAADGVPYDDILRSLDSFGGLPFVPSVKLIDWNYVSSSSESQLVNGAPPILRTGAAPTPLQQLTTGDPLNPVLGVGAAASSAASRTATVLEVVAVAVGLLAIAWIVTEARR